MAEGAGDEPKLTSKKVSRARAPSCAWHAAEEGRLLLRLWNFLGPGVLVLQQQVHYRAGRPETYVPPESLNKTLNPKP